MSAQVTSMTSASTVLQDEVSEDESDEERAKPTDGDGEEREKSLDDIIDAYSK